MISQHVQVLLFYFLRLFPRILNLSSTRCADLGYPKNMLEASYVQAAFQELPKPLESIFQHSLRQFPMKCIGVDLPALRSNFPAIGLSTGVLFAILPASSSQVPLTLTHLTSLRHWNSRNALSKVTGTDMPHFLTSSHPHCVFFFSRERCPILMWRTLFCIQVFHIWIFGK